jgi:hypothetical protein
MDADEAFPSGLKLRLPHNLLKLTQPTPVHSLTLRLLSTRLQVRPLHGPLPDPRP